MASPISAQQARQLVPGLADKALLSDCKHAAALLIQGGLVLDPHRYLRALWAACEHITREAGGGAEVCLIQKKVTSLRALEAEHGPYAAVVVAAGAANGVIEEVGDQLDCTLSQGYALQLVPPASASSDAPALGTLRSLSTAKKATPCEQALAAADTDGLEQSESAPSVTSSPEKSQDGTHGTGACNSSNDRLRWPAAARDASERRGAHPPDAQQASTSPQAASDQQLTGLPSDKVSPGASAHVRGLVSRDVTGEAPPSDAYEDQSRPISELNVGAQTGSLHFKRTFTPAFSLDTGPSFCVRGESPDFVSCLREPATEAWESQQQQIRTTLGLQINPTKTLPSEDAATDGWEAEEDETGRYPEGAPSLLSSKYLAVQGGKRIILGATRKPGLTPEEAFQECGRKITSEGEIAAATAALLPEAERLWQPISEWKVRRVRSGVRALPPKTEKGAMPLGGRLQAGSRWWVLGGLGARGLVYHAWLGELIAQAVLNDSEDGLPKELMRWRSCKVDLLKL